MYYYYVYQINFSLIGVNKARIALLGSVYFVGYSVACMIFPRLCDLYGRRWIYSISIWVQVFVYAGLIFSKTIVGHMILILFLGILGVGRSTIGFLYLMELQPPKNKKLVGKI